jgi:hypothetical protein
MPKPAIIFKNRIRYILITLLCLIHAKAQINFKNRT